MNLFGWNTKLEITYRIYYSTENKEFNYLRITIRTWWGTDVNRPLMFYRPYTLAKIDYGCLLFGKADETSLRTPIESLQAESLESCLTLRRQFLTENAVQYSVQQTTIYNKYFKWNSNISIFTTKAISIMKVWEFFSEQSNCWRTNGVTLLWNSFKPYRRKLC